MQNRSKKKPSQNEEAITLEILFSYVERYRKKTNISAGQVQTTLLLVFFKEKYDIGKSTINRAFENYNVGMRLHDFVNYTRKEFDDKFDHEKRRVTLEQLRKSRAMQKKAGQNRKILQVVPNTSVIKIKHVGPKRAWTNGTFITTSLEEKRLPEKTQVDLQNLTEEDLVESNAFDGTQAKNTSGAMVFPDLGATLRFFGPSQNTFSKDGPPQHQQNTIPRRFGNNTNN